MCVRANLAAAALMCVDFSSKGAAEPTAASPPAIAQVINMFAQTCLKFAGHPETLRISLKARGATELSSSDRVVFMRDHIGVAYNTSTPSAKLAVTSEDNGTCSAFLGTDDSSKITTALHAMLAAAHIPFERVSDEDRPNGPSSVDRLRIEQKDYILVTSANVRLNAPIRAAITLAPRVP